MRVEIFRISKIQLFDILCRGGYTVDERHNLLSLRRMSESQTLERLEAKRQRGEVPVAQQGEVKESRRDYRLHYDQLEACLDHTTETRRIVCDLILDPRAEADSRSRQAAMWKREWTTFWLNL